MEYKGCIKSTIPPPHFPQEFLDNPLFDLIPEGYDICYNTVDANDMIHVHFYLYDSTVPLTGRNINVDDLAAWIHIYFFKPYTWSYGWMPLYNNIIHIPELVTNSYLDGFDLMGAGLGTYMMLCAMAYAKSMNIHYAKLYDASQGFRKDYNIYQKLGFNYEDSTGHDMIGRVDDIINKIEPFIKNKKRKFTSKLQELDKFLDDDNDPDWKPSMNSISDSDSSSNYSNQPRKRMKGTTEEGFPNEFPVGVPPEVPNLSVTPQTFGKDGKTSLPGNSSDTEKVLRGGRNFYKKKSKRKSKRKSKKKSKKKSKRKSKR